MGEQIYGGSIGFRIVPNQTLSFLKEWEEWGKVPVMYGDDEDFPSNIPPPEDYKGHKNDQSVFSLMVRSRNMKTWPAPYFWMGDSGVDKCLDTFKDAGYCFFFQRSKTSNKKMCQPFENWLATIPLLA